jgi:hypothetical protein
VKEVYNGMTTNISKLFEHGKDLKSSLRIEYQIVLMGFKSTINSKKTQ